MVVFFESITPIDEEGTDKLTQGPGLALQQVRSSKQEYVAWLHFELHLHSLSAPTFHFSSKNNLTCQ